VHAMVRQYIVAGEPTLKKLLTAGQAGKTPALTTRQTTECPFGSGIHPRR